MSSLSSKSNSARRLLCFSLWAAALFGSLQLHYFEKSFNHSICGPWGCGPPVMALVGYHAFWILLIVPAAMAASSRLSAGRAIRIGKLIAIAGLGALAWVVVEDGLEFWQTARGSEYLVQRCLFRLVTFVEFPLGPLGLAGLAMQQMGLRRMCLERFEPAEDTL